MATKQDIVIELCEKIKIGERGSFMELEKTLRPIIEDIYNQFKKYTVDRRVTEDDLEQEMHVCLFELAKNFDGSRYYSQYFTKGLESHLNKLFASEYKCESVSEFRNLCENEELLNRRINFVDIDSIRFSDKYDSLKADDQFESIDLKIFRDMIKDIFYNKLSGREKDVFHLYYEKGLTEFGIAKKLGISSSRVNQINHAILRKLRWNIYQYFEIENDPRRKSMCKTQTYNFSGSNAEKHNTTERNESDRESVKKTINRIYGLYGNPMSGVTIECTPIDSVDKEKIDDMIEILSKHIQEELGIPVEVLITKDAKTYGMFKDITKTKPKEKLIWTCVCGHKREEHFSPRSICNLCGTGCICCLKLVK